MKLVLLLRYGIGDWYDLLSMLPEILKDKNLTKDDLKIYVDCIYFHDSRYSVEKESAVKLIELFTKNWEVVPKELGSFDNLHMERVKDMRKVFLPFCRQETKNYIQSKLNTDDILISAFMGLYIYEWKNNTNVVLNFKKEPLRLPLEKPKEILIHIRKKGNYVSDTFYNNIMQQCIDNNIRCILIGNEKEMYIHSNKHILDLRNKLSLGEIFDYIEKADYMISSTSIFAYHRFHTNKPTIFLNPVFTGTALQTPVVRPEYLNNKNYLFLNCDIPCEEDVRVKLVEWFK